MTGPRTERPGLERVVEQLGDSSIVDRLCGVPAADLTTLLLEVASRRASGVSTATTMSRYRSDRFSRPSDIAMAALRSVEDTFIQAVPPAWRWIVLSPLVPVATHARLGELSQDWVVTTTRPNEVAADPTVGLALEAADARRESTARRTAPAQRLAAIQRVVRAQRYGSSQAFVHFEILGLVSAGRSRPGRAFEVEALPEHIAIYVDALSAIASNVEIVLSVQPSDNGRRLFDAIEGKLASPHVQVAADEGRLPEQRYYRTACFKVRATIEGENIEVADGGFTDWTARLLDDEHERMLISGAGLDRPAMLAGSSERG